MIYLLIAATIALWGHSHGYAFLQMNPSYQIAATAKSLWQSGRLEREELYDIYRLQLAKSRDNPNTTYWQDIFSLGRDGQLYPIRAIILSYIAALFYGILGNFGFWVLAQLLSMLILISFYHLSSTLTSPANGMFMSFALLMGTFLLRYSYTFSYDVFAACLIISGLYLLKAFPFWGAFILTASIETRPMNVLYVIFLIFAWLPYYSNRKQAVVSILNGALLSSVGIMLMNCALWGDPLTSGFQRKLAFFNGAAVIEPPAFVFDFWTLVGHWGEKLMGPSGLFRSSPMVVAFPLAVVCAYSSKFRYFYFIAAAAVLTNVIFVYSLPTWKPLGNASRYLLSSIVLMALSANALVDKFWTRKPQGMSLSENDIAAAKND